MASVATWADSIRYTRWGRFTKNFHFIDAHDSPPENCNVDFERDCKESGCVISSLANYTEQLLDPELPDWRRAQAVKFVIHFVGDLHQPLHNEDVALGGNRIHVQWDGRNYNLHHVWDSSIAEKWIGAHGKPYPLAFKWANELSIAITDGKFADEKESWLKDVELQSPIDTAMAWSRECNAFVCSHGKWRRLGHDPNPTLTRSQCSRKGQKPSRARSSGASTLRQPAPSSRNKLPARDIAWQPGSTPLPMSTSSVLAANLWMNCKRIEQQLGAHRHEDQASMDLNGCIVVG